MHPQLLSYTSLTIYYHLIFSFLFFHNGPSTKWTQLQQNYRGPTKLYMSKALLLPILSAPGIVSTKHYHFLITPFSHAPSVKFNTTFSIPTAQFHGRDIKVEESKLLAPTRWRKVRNTWHSSQDENELKYYTLTGHSRKAAAHLPPSIFPSYWENWLHVSPQRKPDCKNIF